jgi:hypothetical protein
MDPILKFLLLLLLALGGLAFVDSGRRWDDPGLVVIGGAFTLGAVFALVKWVFLI